MNGRPAPPYRPSPNTLASPAWAELQQHLKQRLEDLRKQNDDIGLDAEQTATMRGKIHEVKRLMQLGATQHEVTIGDNF